VQIYPRDLQCGTDDEPIISLHSLKVRCRLKPQAAYNTRSVRLLQRMLQNRQAAVATGRFEKCCVACDCNKVYR